MKIGFDLTFLRPDSGGLETYSHRLIEAITERYPTHDAVAFTTKATHLRWNWAIDRLDVVDLPTPDIQRRLGWSVGQFAALPYAAHRAKVDVLHSLGNFAPIAGTTTRVVTIHDPPQFFRHAATPGRLVRLSTAAMVAAGARYADRVITDSDEIRRAIASDRFARVANRVEVVYPGVEVPPLCAAAAPTTVITSHQYKVLYVGTNLPHKNIGTLLRAVALIPLHERPLVMLAGIATDAADLQEHARQLGVSDDVRFFGRVSSGVLEALYQQTDCLVTLTTHEGFGLPVVEAMARSVPVICSSLPVLQEVAGDAALFVDPHQPAEIARTIVGLLRDPGLRSTLRVSGAERARQFTWAAAAEKTVAVYHKAIAAK